MALERLVKNQLNDIEKEFAHIDKNANRKVLLPAIREATKIVKKQAKTNASKWKDISKLIRSTAFIAKSGNVIGKIFVGESKDRTIMIDGREVGFEVVANILEFGRAAPGQSGGTLVVQPEAFIRNAPKQAESKVASTIQREVIQRLRKV